MTPLEAGEAETKPFLGSLKVRVGVYCKLCLRIMRLLQGVRVWSSPLSRIILLVYVDDATDAVKKH